MEPGEEKAELLPPNGITPDGATINIQRPAYTQQDVTSSYNLQWEQPPGVKQRLKTSMKEKCACSAGCLQDQLLRLFPCVGVLKEYQWRQWLLLDIISGISVGVIQIPQGMGFALLTNLPPVYGLYSSLFPVLIYFIFGTSRHISMGTMALVSLMIGSVVTREVEKLGLDGIQSGNVTGGNASLGLEEQAQLESVAVGTAVSVSLMVGCFQILMGLVGLGAIATFMSMPFISSFLTAAAVHIITSQVPSLFGLKLPGHPGMFKVPMTYYELFYHITETNIAALVTGLLCLLILYVLKEVINERCKGRMKAPIPAELLVVVVVTLISHFCNLNELYGLKIVGPIPSGLPAPSVPPMNNAGTYISDSIIVAVISFAISISMAKLMAKKHGYPIDVRQELFAYGIAHSVSSFFNCFAGAQAPPRTLVHDSVGGKTQVGSIVSCIMILLVCLFLGMLFESLPIPALAAIIIVALIPMFRQFKQVPHLWSVSRLDFYVWIITFLSAVILDITTGLMVGMILSIFLVVYQAHQASGSTLVHLNQPDIYLPKDKLICDQAFENPGIQVFRFGAPLFFVNVEKFKAMMYEKTGVTKIPHDQHSNVLDEMTIDINVNEKNHDEPDIKMVNKNMKDVGSYKLRTIVLDCSPMSYIDIMGIGMIQGLGSELKGFGVKLVLAAPPTYTYRKLEAAGVVGDDVDKMTVYPSIQDAVTIETKYH